MNVLTFNTLSNLQELASEIGSPLEHLSAINEHGEMIASINLLQNQKTCA